MQQPLIAKPIPMKRELKPMSCQDVIGRIDIYCKAHPDEKGIETKDSVFAFLSSIQHCKAHPDEKGIET